MRTIPSGFFFSRTSIHPGLRIAIQCTFLVLFTSLVAAQEVKMYSGCNVVLSGNIYLVMNNTAFKNNGSFTAGSSTVVFTGNTDTSISNVSGTSKTTFNNLSLNKSAYGISLKSWVGVKNIFTLSAGKFYSNTNLTLLSDSDNTARLAPVISGAFIYGTVMVERYIPSKRAWRLMTAPVTNAASVYNSWQNAGVYTVGKGLLISGPGATNGLDNGNAYSLKKWNVATQSFSPITNTYTSISATNTGSADNTGYFVFIRGDRNPANFKIPNSNITTLTSIGGLQTGAQVFSGSGTGGAFTLIGNPYASPVDFSNLTRSNMLKRFTIWDPTLNSFGGYVTMDDIDNDGTYSKSFSASAQTSEIQSSQAFFVETAATGAASLTFNESSKSTINNTHIFRAATNTLAGISGSLRANVYLNNDTTILLADGSLAEFGTNFTDAVTNEDALKFSNVNETIGFGRYGKTLAIERRPLITIADTLFVNLSKTTRRNYQLQLVPTGLDRPGLTAYLEDSYLATSARISLARVEAINFTVDDNPGSADAGRFKIVFKKATALPVTISQVKAFKQRDNIKVDWQAHGDADNAKYEVEKSADGNEFNHVNTTAANAAGIYSWIDATPFSGNNFYRIKSVSADGNIKYSTLVNVPMELAVNRFIIQPNPVKGSIIHISFNRQPKGKYRFSLINSDGQPVFDTQEHITGSSTLQELNTHINLPAGLYQLQITGPANFIETQNLIISNK